jgi:peptide-methionine (S)-S-oxide reductase
LDYDPAKISYEQLLDVFWDSHDAVERPWSRQYMSILFFHNEEQRRLAILSRDRESARRKGKIFTEIVPAGQFYVAEAYHQKYRLRREPGLMKEFSAMYPDTNGFVNSTAAARVNGYLDGYGTLEVLQEELSSLGLSPAAGKRFVDAVKRQGLKPGCRS